MARKKSKTAEAKAAETAETAAEVVTEDVVEAEVVEGAIEDVAEEATEALDEPEPSEPENEADEEPLQPLEPVQTVMHRKSGFFPMLLGGIVAGAIGFGAALYVLPELPKSWLPDAAEDQSAELIERIEAQDKTIATLKAEIATASDNTAVEDSLGAVKAGVDSLAADVASLKTQVGGIAALSERMTTLEKAPMADASPEAVAAFKREMEALQAALAAQRAEVEEMAAAAEAKNASAEMTAQDALKRSAMSQILTSLETGSGFADATNSLTAAGVDVPAALAAQADGVPSLDALAESFVEPARAALATARDAESGGGFSGFLKTQLGARSLEPREGDDADAVLSRVEAAVRDGRIGDALAEAEALPEPAKAELKDWTDAASARQAALKAAEALSQQINSN
ncbi:hypothetical protein KO498_01005 [Lentibacter algarum]|uniref:COG4223 family protein n=1 Tax=Lentibacter algarum TaxID=576131 RepID=UPI001C06AE4C|nr:hypothetical protein [Lentibacter algarum]MBU2980377.1 hypothetical protein [Lentibacter algarum]